MTFYIRRGTAMHITDAENMQIESVLPPATYTINVSPMGEMYLDVIDNFSLPAKLYGSTTAHADRILRTFNDRTASTGVLLTGVKGSGKSLLAKTLSTRCLEAGIPTLVIAKPYCGEDFNAFIQKIEQPMVVLFDEFEKVYDHSQQEAMLTLLDGLYPTKKLFVLTCNDQYRVNSHMRNRPGRLYYSLTFNGLEEPEIRGYCEDNLLNKHHIDDVVKFAGLFGEFNFDMLKALVEEMNRFNEPVGEAFRMLNTQPGSDTSERQSYDITLYAPSGAPLRNVYPRRHSGLPMSGHHATMAFSYDDTAETKALKSKAKRKPKVGAANTNDFDKLLDSLEGVDGDGDRGALFNATQFCAEMSLNGAQAFRNEAGFTVVFTPERVYSRDYSMLF